MTLGGGKLTGWTRLMEEAGGIWMMVVRAGGIRLNEVCTSRLDQGRWQVELKIVGR